MRRLWGGVAEKIPSARRPWNPTFQRAKGGAPAVWVGYRTWGCEVPREHSFSSAGVERFASFVVTSRGMGSFDCVRLAPHFAQDDRVEGSGVAENPKYAAAVESHLSKDERWGTRGLGSSKTA
jgi:hypothetical protein